MTQSHSQQAEALLQASLKELASMKSSEEKRAYGLAWLDSKEAVEVGMSGMETWSIAAFQHMEDVAWAFTNASAQALEILVDIEPMRMESCAALTANPFLSSSIFEHLIFNKPSSDTWVIRRLFRRVPSELITQNFLNKIYSIISPAASSKPSWKGLPYHLSTLSLSDLILKTREVHGIEDSVPDSYVEKMFLELVEEEDD